MAKYNITFKKSVAKDLRNIPAADIKRILKPKKLSWIVARASKAMKIK